ncbi:MAG: TRAP transporter TatT component family protein [Pseudomonadales bacterium]|nr:TRAP transporter TatT component family protein [Pseudomonadales bacterium]
MSSVTSDLAEGLSEAIMNNEDIQVVRDGAPAYLILLDGLVQQSPKNINLLGAAASLNSAYAAAFVEDEERIRSFSDKAFDYALRAACKTIKAACTPRSQPYAEFELWVGQLGKKHVPMMYALGANWAGWIQAHSDDWNAIAELSRVKLLMNRIAELDEAYDFGGPRMYLGVFETLLPPALGGRPEVGRRHFERAIQLSGGVHLFTKVVFAQQYARLVFDQQLHDNLLNEVLSSDSAVGGIALLNNVAKEQARKLLKSSVDYF